MIPLKWKLYRVSNYLLLVSGSIIFLRFLQQSILDPTTNVYAIFFGIILFLMILQSVVNLVIMAKTFPNKQLTLRKYYWHIFATFCNSVIALAFIYFTVSEVLPELGKEQPYKLLLFIALGIFLFLIANSIFVLICQLNIKSYLRKNNANLIKSMIDSIGEE